MFMGVLSVHVKHLQFNWSGRKYNGLLILIHNNTDVPTSVQQWDTFFEAANASGMFRGGSEIANRELLGKKTIPNICHAIGGFMRFETDDKPALLALLEQHPVVLQGGSLELCEMPVT